jgi:glutamyl-tRNA synthetase
MTKLLWFNSQYIKKSTPEYIADQLLPFMKVKPQKGQPHLHEVVKTLQNRASTLVEMAEKAEFYYKAPGKQKFNKEEVGVLATTLEAVESVKDNVMKLEDVVTSALLAKKMTIKTHGNVLRRALTGSTVSPGLWEMMCVLGRAETSKRLKEAL